MFVHRLGSFRGPWQIRRWIRLHDRSGRNCHQERRTRRRRSIRMRDVSSFTGLSNAPGAKDARQAHINHLHFQLGRTHYPSAQYMIINRITTAIAMLSLAMLATWGCCRPSTPNAPLEAGWMPGGPDAREVVDAGSDGSSPTDAAPAFDTSATADVGGPWVLFHRPAYAGSTGNHDGPDWSFETPMLPAIAGDGTRILIPQVHMEALGAEPNMELLVMRIADEKVASSTPILEEDEFSSAADLVQPQGSDEARAGRVFRDLGLEVGARVERANRELSAQDWKQLSACTIEQGEGVAYPCSPAAQNITCGAAKVVYRQGQVAISEGTRRAKIHRSSWTPAPIEDPNTGGKIPVRSCFGGMWFDAERGVFVGKLIRACQGGGDWCSAPSSWHVVTIAM